MNTKYFALLTDSGTDKLEKAALSGTKLEITHMVVGDGGGSLPTPASSQSGLINERHRAEIDALAIVPGNPNQIIAEQIIPEGEGNWWVREIGLLDKDGTLIAVGNCVDLYKAESKEQTVRMSVTVNDSSQTNSINGFISGIATRNYVREKIRAHAESRNHPRATLKEQGFVALSNAVNSNNETQAATPKAIKTTYELADKAYQLATSISSTTKDKYVPLTRKINGKELKNDVALTASDVQAYSKPETDGLIQPVKLQAEEALKQAETANKNAGTAITQAESKVPLIRRINGKELNHDVELTASDVNAYSKAETDSLIQPVRALAEDAMQLAETANKNAGTAATQAESKVPLIRKINGKELTNDVDLAAADVNAYSKAETDNLIQPVKLQAEEAIKQAEAASNLADSKVPLTRKINGRELNHDVELVAADINAYSKAETDNLIQPVKLQAEEALKLADSKVPLTRKINGKELTNDVELIAADINAYSKPETDNLIQPVKAQAEEAIKLADSKVPLTRKINGKELNHDVDLAAADVNAYSKAETDNLIQPVKLQAEEAIKQAEAASNLADSKVPLTRKINGRELNHDVELVAADINAYSKAETDNLIQPVKLQAEEALKLADSKVPLTRKINGKELTNDVELIAADINAYSKPETDNLIQPVKAQAEEAIKLADSKVPLTRKINGKELNHDVDLAAADVNAYSKAETDNLIQPVKLQAEDALKLADSKVPLTRKINGKELTNDVDLAAADINAYSKAETDNLIQPVKLQAEEALKLADSKVPLTRKINGKELNQDVELAAVDVNAYSKAETDNLIQPVKLQTEEAIKQAEAASKLADSKVPLTRKINGRELNHDVDLAAADINAYSKAETDSLIQPVKAQAEDALKLAESKVPLTRKINGRELNHDVDLAAADINAYSKAETDSLIQPVKLQTEEAIKQAEAASKLADSKVPLTRKINGKELNHDVDLAAADINAYSKAETDSLIQPVKLQTEEAIKQAEAASKLADSKVPLTRKINGKELTNDVDLAAADINAYSKAETDSLIQPVKLQTEEAIKQAEAASKLADSKVPLTRKINGKELNHDVDLAAADINAYSKAETDNLIQPVKLQTEEAIKQAEAASKLADSKVPLTRKINGRELNHDIDLAAADINAYSKAETDNLIQPVKLQTEEAIKQAEAASKLADSKVPLTRKINGKELNHDVDLAAADINAYSKAETDNLIQPVKLQAEEAIKLADSKVPLTRKINGKELTNDVELTASDINTYSKPETDNLIQPVKLQTEEAIKQAEAASNLADSKVPLTRKINGRELNHDVDLAAADVNAYSKAETDNLIQPVKLQAEEAIKQAEAASNLADSKVPLTRKINGKELTNDVELTASDINTYSKAETDSLIQPVKLQTEEALKLAESKVPLTRKINGKELNQDVELVAADINAYSKAETDNLIQPVKLQAEEAMKQAEAAIKLADSKVPLTRRINGKELTDDVELTASDIHVYTTEEVDHFINEIRSQANEANNNANSRIPMSRTVNGKALSSDIKLIASDIGTYTKTEIDIKIEDIAEKAKEANNNADSRVPMSRTVNNKALSSDIKLIASDVDAYTRAEVNTRISKAEALANNANTNAEGRLAKSKNGSDIQDKQAFVRNIGLGELIGLDISSRLIGDEHTVIQLGDIFMVNGLATVNEPIGNSNPSVINGVTYYTHFYTIKLPITLPNGIISGRASIVGDNLDHQRPSHLADVKTQRNNANGIGLSQDTLTVSVMTPQLGWVPHFYYQIVGY